MAVYRIFPTQDTFISTEVPTGNAGKDEIVELGGYPDITGLGKTNRILVQYSTTDILNVLSTKVDSRPYTASLHMYLADAYDIPTSYTIYAYPLSQSWYGGVGKFGDSPINTSGVSWQYRSAGSTDAWITSGFVTGTTGSFTVGQEGGGVWYTGYSTSASFDITLIHDVDLNVTAAITAINNGDIVNNGFIIKLQDSLESQISSSVRLKYFSADTNTIYPPYLEFKWDDSTYNTGSLSTLNTNIAIVNITNNIGKYVDNGKQRFRVSARPKYPARTFTTVSPYTVNYALPSASYWGLRDENTQEMVVDFDTNCTKISCDSTGGYFDVYMDGLQPERYYRVLIKTELDGSTTVIDNQNIFKVVRNG
ncbi:MAG TPA: hypothetical protein PKC87_00665 [Candidatus Absconditabacterales bacterium]|nr:hypothetical protein [Candidatus Absconditabacterales bacterium]